MKTKAILYSCSGLMCAAAIAGVVDYTLAGRKGTLKKLYAAEVPAAVAPRQMSDNGTVVPPPPPPVKEISFENYSRAYFRPPVEYITVDVDLPDVPLEETVQDTLAPPSPPKTVAALPTVEEPGLMVDSAAPEPAPAPPSIPVDLIDNEKKDSVVIPTPPLDTRIFSRAPLPPKKNAKKKKAQ